MEILILLISLFIFGLVFWLLFEMTKTAKHLTNKNYNHHRSDIVQLAVLLLLIILIVPLLFTLPIFDLYKSDSGGVGEIGDAIGGLTAPFINGVGAVLIYVAFKEQVKVTHQNRNLELYKIVSDRLSWLKTDPYDIVGIENGINQAMAARVVPQHQYNKVTYMLIEFEELYNLASKNTDEKENLVRQIQFLYRILYRDRMTNIQKQSNIFIKFNLNSVHPDIMIVLDYSFLFEKVDKKLGI